MSIKAPKLRRPPVLDRLLASWSEPPRPSCALQVSAGFVGGLRAAGRDRRRVLRPLAAGAIVPSFDRPNVADAAEAGRRVDEALAALDPGAARLGLVLPELAARVFVFAFDELPSVPREREDLVRWRVGKQMPTLPDDLRLSYQAFPAASGVRVVAAAARAAIVREYEDLLARARGGVGLVTTPTLGLLRLSGGDGDGVLVDVEEDALALSAVAGGEVRLYRQKALPADGGGDSSETVRTIVQEVMNTAHFAEDREGMSVARLRLRVAWPVGGDRLASALAAATGLPVERAESWVGAGLEGVERDLLAPLAGVLS